MHLRIRLGAEHYALGLEHVLEVVELGEITPVPGSSMTLLGLRNLRGEILPALDLAALLGIVGDGDPRRLVVVAEGELRAGLAVDEVIDIGQLPETRGIVDSSLLRGGVLVDGVLVGVVDVAAVLGSPFGLSTPVLA
jgi:chemotaxis signal transduction protein